MRDVLPRLTLILFATLALPACGSLLTEGSSDVAGIAGAGIAGSVSKDAAVGAAIGLGVRSIADTGLKYVERRVHRAEQDRIASIAGVTEVGAVAPWAIDHDIPIEDDQHGHLSVVRTVGDGDLACKEIVFSVETGKPEVLRRGFYTATVCQDGKIWKWATAEPAVERWGSLQ